MIGAGVFTSSGYSLAALEHPGRVMLAWWLCGLWAVCGAIAYGALVSRLPESGGEYLFLSRFVHRSIGFLAGWISVIAGFTAPIAAAALGAAIYGLPIFVDDVSANDPRLAGFACGIIVIATICHAIGVSIGTGIQNTIVAAKLVLILVVIAWAFGFTESGSWQGKTAEGTAWLPDDLSSWSVLVGSMSWIALSYTGFNAAIYVAGESRSARRVVPLAMVLATCVVTTIYLLLNYVFVYAPSGDSIAGQGEVATIAAKAIGGAQLEWLVRITIALAMVSSVFAMLLAGPRVYQKMAEDGVMPKILKGTTTLRSVPLAATFVQAILSIIALYAGTLLQLMKYLGLTLSACGALAVLSLVWAKRKLPDSQPLRVWEIVPLVIYLTITATILAASWTAHRSEFYAMLLTFGLGAVVYAIFKAMEQKAD